MDKEIALRTVADGGCELFLRHLGNIANWSATDTQLIGSLPVTIVNIADNQEVVRQGSQPKQCFLVVRGLIANAKLTKGGRCQISSFYIPGDMPDLQNLYLMRADSEFRALTAAKVGFISHTAITEICRRSDGISHAFWRMSLIDAAVFREWVTNIGQRTSYERIGHVLCEMFVRLQVVGLINGYSYSFPISQEELSEAVGISPVHVNRVLQQLRRENLIEFEAGKLTILDWQRLTRASDFEPSYLHFLPRFAASRV